VSNAGDDGSVFSCYMVWWWRCDERCFCDHMIRNDIVVLVFYICGYGFCYEGGYRLRKTWPQKRLSLLPSSFVHNMKSRLTSWPPCPWKTLASACFLNPHGCSLMDSAPVPTYIFHMSYRWQPLHLPKCCVLFKILLSQEGGQSLLRLHCVICKQNSSCPTSSIRGTII
jgi:hypothetical protein